MSWWITTKGPRGRKYLWSINADGLLFALLFVLALLAALVVPHFIKSSSNRKNPPLSSGDTKGKEPKMSSADNLH